MSDALTAYRRLIADVYELTGLSRRISDREAAMLGSSVARWHVLSVISETPAAVPAIAARLGHRRQPVQRVVDDLLDTGRARRAPNPAHARSSLIAITPAGRRELDRLWSATEAARRRLLLEANLRAEDLDEADAVLRALLHAMRHAS